MSFRSSKSVAARWASAIVGDSPRARAALSLNPASQRIWCIAMQGDRRTATARACGLRRFARFAKSTVYLTTRSVRGDVVQIAEHTYSEACRVEEQEQLLTGGRFVLEGRSVGEMDVRLPQVKHPGEFSRGFGSNRRGEMEDNFEAELPQPRAHRRHVALSGVVRVSGRADGRASSGRAGGRVSWASIPEGMGLT